MKKYLLLAKYNIALMGLYHALVQEKEASLFAVTKTEAETYETKINMLYNSITEYQRLKDEIKTYN